MVAARPAAGAGAGSRLVACAPTNLSTPKPSCRSKSPSQKFDPDHNGTFSLDEYIRACLFLQVITYYIPYMGRRRHTHNPHPLMTLPPLPTECCHHIHRRGRAPFRRLTQGGPGPYRSPFPNSSIARPTSRDELSLDCLIDVAAKATGASTLSAAFDYVFLTREDSWL